MRLLSWLSARTTRRPRTRRAPARKPTLGFRPRVEVLEGRDLTSTLTVTNPLDGQAGSLRAEIAAAKTNDTIVFAPSLDGQTIKLYSELHVTTNLTIQGPGAGQLTISGVGGRSRLFEVGQQVGPNVSVTLSGLTLTNGNGNALNQHGAYGGAILNWGTLTVSACTVTNCIASYGGGIANFGTLTLSGCTISGNTAAVNFPTNGHEGGGIYNGGTLTVIACTVSGNHTQGGPGGGIYNNQFGTLTVNNSTFSGNTATNGAGIANGGKLTLGGGVFSGNYPDTISGPYTDSGGNSFS